MKERIWNYDFKYTGDLLACKNAIVGFFIVSYEDVEYTTIYRKGRLTVTYKHSRSLDNKLNKLAQKFDSSKKGG